MSLTTRAWTAWKSLSLPWRRRRLAGTDLDGNTYWEHTDALGRRPRRIVAYKRAEADYVDYKLTPQWHQWLRYTRADAPSVRELQGDIVRLAALRRNAAIADERWRGGGGVLPKQEQEQKEGEGDPWREADAAGGYRPHEWKGVRRREG